MSTKACWQSFWLGFLTFLGVLWWPLLIIYILVGASAGLTLAMRYTFRLTVWRQ